MSIYAKAKASINGIPNAYFVQLIAICWLCMKGYTLNVKTQICEPSCSEGQYYNLSIDGCYNCISNCFSCLNSNTCTLCNSGYTLDQKLATCKLFFEEKEKENMDESVI